MRFIARLLKFIVFLAFLTVFGLVLGFMVVALPPLAWIAVVGVAAVVMLWVLPDLPHMPEPLLRRLFLVAVVAQLSVPAYYAYAAPGLPWISVRRITWIPALALAALSLATAQPVRKRAAALISETRSFSFLVFAFYGWLCLSVVTSISPATTMSGLSDSMLYWVMAFVTCVLCVRDEEDSRRFLRILCVLPLMAGPAGLVEYLTKKHFIYTFWPESWLTGLYSSNSVLLNNITRDAFRNGEFRVNYIYNVALSYAEFLAILGPIALFFMLHGRRWPGRMLGAVSLVCCVIGIFCSGSRGGWTSLAASLPVMAVLWIIRTMREKPSSMVGALSGTIFTTGMAGFITLAIAWGPLRKLFTGGGEGQGSTDIRLLQWNMALPSIEANPITGYGHAVGGIVVGYVTPGGTATVDSYIITLLVDAGVPALLLFFSMVGIAIYQLLRAYLTDPDPRSVAAAATATALISFLVYRIALSQSENHFLLFTLLGVAVVQVSASKRRMAASRTEQARLRSQIGGLRPATPRAGSGFGAALQQDRG